MNVKNRLKDFIKSQNISISAFEKEINVSNGYVNSISKGIGGEVLLTILEKSPMLNIDWLLTGSGSMLKEVAPVQADCMGKVEELEKYNKVLEENCQLWREKAGTLEKELQALKKPKQDAPAVGKL